MAINYSKGKPVGNNGVPQFEAPPAVRAVQVTGSTNQAASSVITLSQDTTAVEVGAAGAGAVVIKWISQSDTTASVVGIGGASPNFDHYIPQGTVRRFVVPVETFPNGAYSGTPPVTSQVGANRENGLFRRLAVLGVAGTASVLTTEYGNMV